MRYGYARVSTREQDETRQVEALKRAGVQEIIIEKASGKNFIDREEWQKLMAKVVPDDVIVVKSLDRLGRNNAEIKETFELLAKRSVYLEFIDNEILNTRATTEAEKMSQNLIQPIVLHLMGFFAERERQMIKERQAEAYKQLEKDEKGRLISRKRGTVCGRPNIFENLTKKQKDVINRWILKAIKTDECVALTGIGRSTLFRIKKQMLENN